MEYTQYNHKYTLLFWHHGLLVIQIECLLGRSPFFLKALNVCIMYSLKKIEPQLYRFLSSPLKIGVKIPILTNTFQMGGSTTNWTNNDYQQTLG